MAINENQIKNCITGLSNQISTSGITNRFPQFQDGNPVQFWNQFLEHFKLLNSKEFIITHDSKSFVFTILYYFLQMENFYRSPNLYKLDSCEVSLNKGLIIIGGFGIGKTVIMKTIVSMIEKISINSRMIRVRLHNTIEIVEEFENSDPMTKNHVIGRYSKGFRVFDDIKNEREASNFGKVDLFKEILYKRCENKNYRTILLCNYDSECPNDMHQAIESFERYGDRNFDRLFEAFNFIEFKGRSNRR